MPSDFRRILERPHAERVEFIVVDGMAMVSHGSAFITNDLDVCYRRARDNLTRLVRAISPLGPHLRGAPPDLPFRLDEPTIRSGLNFTLVTEAGDLDLLGEVVGVGEYDAMVAEAEPMDIEGHRTLVMSLDQLIRAKRAAGRRKDLLHLDELQEIRRRR